ncbi:helix-turn-helix domain-containing protein [soil metagenome]
MRDDMDAVFEALAHVDRRRILDIVKNNPGCYLNEICPQFNTSRIALMKHLRVLETAQLIVARHEGRRRRLFHNPVPIQIIYDRWTTEYSSLWAGEITRIKYNVESKSTSKRRKGKSNG